MVSFRRVYDTTIKKFAIGGSLIGFLGFLIFAMLAARGDITIISASGDMGCAIFATRRKNGKTSHWQMDVQFLHVGCAIP